MTGFIIASKPDEAFEYKGKGPYIRTNTSSNIKLKDNIELQETDVVRLIEAGRKVILYDSQTKQMDCYNFEDEMELLSKVVRF